MYDYKYKNNYYQFHDDFFDKIMKIRFWVSSPKNGETIDVSRSLARNNMFISKRIFTDEIAFCLLNVCSSEITVEYSQNTTHKHHNSG